jgi:hypothetical protein
LESVSQSLPKIFQIPTFPRDVTAFFKMAIKKIVGYTDKNHLMKKEVRYLLMLARNKTYEEASNNEDSQLHQ